MRGLLAAGVTTLALMVATAAHSKPLATLGCQAPYITTVRWHFKDAYFAGWNVAIDVSFRAYGSGKITAYVNSTWYDWFWFEHAGTFTTELLQGSHPVYDGRPLPVRLEAEADCGKVSDVTFIVKAPHTGQLGNDHCPNYEIVDTRGSGEPQDQMSPPAGQFLKRFQDLHKTSSVEVETNPYPAVGGITKEFVAWAKLPLGAYHKSVVAGKKWLVEELSQLPDECPSTTIYLTGYSQGAQVTADVYQKGSWPQVAGVVLFGDPYFNPADKADRGGFSPSQHGALGKRPVFAAAKDGKIRSYCHKHDPVCQGFHEVWLHGLSQHDNYAELGEPEAAAEYFSQSG